MRKIEINSIHCKCSSCGEEFDIIPPEGTFIYKKRMIVFWTYCSLYGFGLGIMIAAARNLDYMTFVIAGYALWVVFIVHLLSLGLNVRKESKGIESTIGD